jgi:hypothetical protein
MAHEMTLMNTVRVIVAKHTAIVDSGQVGHKEGKVVLNDFARCIDPDFFAQDSDAARTPETSFIISILEQTVSPGHGKILAQVMLLAQYLKVVSGPS